MKKITITAIIVALFTMFAIPAMADFYPTCAVLTVVDRETDTLTFEDVMGRTWTMQGCEDWEQWYFAALLMDDNGTPEIADDIVVKAHYQMTVEDWAIAFPQKWGE